MRGWRRAASPGGWLATTGLTLLLGCALEPGSLPGAPSPQDALDGEFQALEILTMAPGLPRVLEVERTPPDVWTFTTEEAGVEGTVSWEVELAVQDSIPLLHGAAFADRVHEALLEYTLLPGLPDSLRHYLIDPRVQELRELQLRLRRTEMPGYLTVRRLALRDNLGWHLEPAGSPVGVVYAGVRVAYLAAASDLPDARRCIEERGVEVGFRCASDALKAHLGL